MKKILLLALYLFCFGTPAARAITLVKNGVATAEIVLASDATPSVKTAAGELQLHLEKISGAKLPIVDHPTPGDFPKIYVGESQFTKALGFNLDGVVYDGFKVVATGNHIILAGKEFYRMPILGRFMTNTRTEDWQKITGRKWRFPAFHDFRTYSKDYDFCAFDATGTLYAVYDLLEQLGMRWYMPVADIGIVYPELKTVDIASQNKTVSPEFPIREFEPVNGKFKYEFLWWKSMRVGSAFIYPQEHSLGSVLKFPEGNPPESYGVVNGKIDYSVPRLNNEGLRSDHVKYLEAVLQEFPQLEYVSITPNDGWGTMDDRDVAAGWNKAAERGRLGAFSDYTWDHIMAVRERLMKNHPDLKFITYAYISNKLPPTKPEKIPDNITVAFCQSTSQFMTPESRDDLKIREEWLEKIGPGKMFVYDYYYEHAPNRNFPPIPVVFSDSMEKSFAGMYGRTGLGTVVCIAWDYESTKAVLRRPALSHLMIYLHNRLLWKRDLDVKAVLNEYYEKFFGPAQAEMKEFYEFSEKVWMRPGAREISIAGGFLKQADVDGYFEILHRAKAKAGDTIYGQRIDLFLSEMEPLKTLFANMERKGAPLEGFQTKQAFKIDGDLQKPFWTERRDSFVPLRDMITGEYPTHVETRASVRWLPDGNKLVIGIECLEPKMDRLKTVTTTRDNRSIFADDNVEIRLETPQGLRPLICVSANGTVLDENATTNAADLPHFYSVDDVIVRQYKDRWTVEVVIDAKTLGADRPSKTFPWGIAINRQRLAGNTPEYYMLTPSGTNFQDITNLGNLSIR